MRNVGEGEHHAVNHVLDGTVRQNAHLMMLPIRQRELPLRGDKGLHHFRDVGEEVDARKLSRQIGQRAPDIARDEPEHSAGRGSKFRNAHFPIQKDGGNLGAGEKILQVIVNAVEFAYPAAQLRVDGFQFFMRRLHLFLRCL